MTRLVVATGNAHKVTEIGAILAAAGLPVVGDDGAGGGVELVPMTTLGVPSPVEDGDTFEANALIKARACVAATGEAAIADDSGIAVDVLDGAPGIHSARYAGPDATDADNNARLLAALADVPVERRTARFVCVAALVTPDGRETTRRGELPGRVVDAAGAGGFGYDPHFLADVSSDGRTTAELSAAEKDAISHRGTAFRALATDLRAWLDGDA